LAKAKAVNTLGKVVDPYLEYQQRRLTMKA
jgi:hypothetical protein